MTITVTSNGSKGLGSVRRNLSGYARRIPKAGRAGLWNFTQHVAKRLREEAPEGGTGRMKNIQYTYAKKLDKNSYGIIMPAYTKHLEEGTSPHFIPNTWKTRAWANKKLGGFSYPFMTMRAIIAKKGTKAHPFTARVIRTEVKKLKKKVEQKINNAIKRTAR